MQAFVKFSKKTLTPQDSGSLVMLYRPDLACFLRLAPEQGSAS